MSFFWNALPQNIFIDHSFFLFIFVFKYYLRVKVSHSVMSNSLWPTGVGSLSLLQRFFPNQGSNPGPLHCKHIFFYQLSPKGISRILEWVVNPFSRRSSWYRDWTGVSCITGRLFANWAIKESNTYSEWNFLVTIFKINYSLPYHPALLFGN